MTRIRCLQRWLFCLVIVMSLAMVGVSAAPRARSRPSHKPSAPSCADPMALQVRLDREGFSSGQIDGRVGTNARRALSAYKEAHGLPPNGRADCETWRALGGDEGGPAITSYTITLDDVKGPFIDAVPADLEKAAKLPALGYTSVLEALSERFHAAPALLKRLNARARFIAGEQIHVPAVTPFEATARPPHDA